MEKQTTQSNNTNNYIKRVKGKKKRKKRDVTHLFFSNNLSNNENKEKSQIDDTDVSKKEIVNQWESDQVGTVNLKLINDDKEIDHDVKQGWSDDDDTKPLIFSIKTEKIREQEHLKQIIKQINEEEQKMADNKCDEVNKIIPDCSIVSRRAKETFKNKT